MNENIVKSQNGTKYRRGKSGNATRKTRGNGDKTDFSYFLFFQFGFIFKKKIEIETNCKNPDMMKNSDRLKWHAFIKGN